MFIVGVDPGITTGLAAFNSTTREVPFWFESTDVIEVTYHIVRLNNMYPIDRVVIEDFIGNGMRNPTIVHTIKVLGAFEQLVRILKLDYTIRPPQYRKAFIKEAVGLAGIGAHYIDALAHAMAEAHRMQREANYETLPAVSTRS
jgi:hypothetical protein